MTAYTPLTPEQRAAREVERRMERASKLADLGAAATNLAAVERMGLDPLNTSRLWAEWYYAKAQRALDGDGYYDEMFAEACAELGVDEDGEDTSDRPENFGASHPDAGRGFRL